MNKKNTPVRTFVAIGIGAALFFVLGRFVTIPIFTNTTLNLQYAVLAFFAVTFGPLAGALIGLIGHTLIDFTLYGPWWSWIIASTVLGFLLGLLGTPLKPERGIFTKREAIGFNIVNVISNVIAWILIAPILDILIYKEPASKVFAQGAISAVVNILTTAVLGTILLYAYTKTITQKGSLSTEDDEDIDAKEDE